MTKQNPVAAIIAATAAVASMACIAFVGAAPVRAQGNGQGHAPISTPAPVSTRPEVQVVVMPVANGQWAVSEVYFGQVPSAKAIERLANLLKVGGWTPTSPPSFEDAALDAGSFRKSGATAPPPVMSSVRCTLRGNVVDPAQGVINIAPFFASLRDLSRVNVVFMSPLPAGVAYHGIQHLDNPQITIDQTGTQGTYLFVANIKDHSATPLSLADTNAAAEKTTASRVNVLPFLFGLAVAVGLLVYYWATRFVSGGSRK